MFNLLAANLHDGNAHNIALLVAAAAASGAFDPLSHAAPRIGIG